MSDTVSNGSWFDGLGRFLGLGGGAAAGAPAAGAAGGFGSIAVPGSVAAMPLGEEAFGGAGFAGKLTPGAVPGVAGAVNNASGLGWNVGTGQMALGGLNALGSAWTAYNANKLAKEQFAFTKGIATTNLNNSIKSYNTQLGDRVSARSAVNNTSKAESDAYLKANQVSASA